MEKAWITNYKRYRRSVAQTDAQGYPQEDRQLPDIDKENRVFRITGNYVFGPALNGFVLWVLKNAMRSGKQRLYFLARDGYLMYRAASIYVEKLSLPIECRYLYCSRYSLRLPVLHLDQEEAMEYICRDSIGVTLERIMDRAGLTEEEQSLVLDEISETGRAQEMIPHASLEKLKQKLRRSAAFSKALDTHSREALPSLTGYLRQEGLMEDKKAALVDSGWVGSMQKTLNSVLEYMGSSRRLEGYYWGLYELPAGAAREEYHCYYFAPEGQLREKVWFNNNLFETVFSAPHGMTAGYEERDGKYEPVCVPVPGEQRRRMEKLERVLTGYIRREADSLRNIDHVDCRKERQAVRPVIMQLMGNPAREEAEIYGRMSFCDDVLEYARRPLAKVLDENGLRANHALRKILVLTGICRGERKESAWYEGSAVLGSGRPGRHLFQYRIYKYLLYMRQMCKWRKKDVQKNIQIHKGREKN